MLIDIYTHGSATRFGKKFRLDVSSPREAIRALSLQIPGFSDMVVEGEWHIFRGPLDREDDYSEETLDVGFGEQREMHLVPVIRGSGQGGMFSIILGIIAIVAAPFTGGWSAAFYAAGAGLIVGGIIQMTIKIPGADTNTESADSKASFLFSGPKNQSTQGVAIPRGYGRSRVGSVVVSAGLYAEELSA